MLPQLIYNKIFDHHALGKVFGDMLIDLEEQLKDELENTAKTDTENGVETEAETMQNAGQTKAG